MTIGERIRQRREALGYLQCELAEMVQVDPSMICQIERGSKIPTLALGRQLADVLHCSLDELAGRDARIRGRNGRCERAVRNPIKRQPLKQRPPRKHKTDKGEIDMTNTELLRRKIKESGYKVGFLAEKMGITYHGLLNKINNRSDFRARELAMLAGLLQLPREEWFAVFFAGEADKA